MSRLPSPFQKDLPKVFDSCSSSPSSPGFLMMTRPANVSSDITGRSFGRANNRGYHVRHQHSYSSPNSASFRNQDQKGGYNRGSYSPRFLGQQKSLPTPSPNRNFYGNVGNNSFSGLPSFQSTPNSSFSSKGTSFHYSPHFNAKRNKHDTPLKDIPVDKFISRNMILDPWEAFPSDAPSAQNESPPDIDVPKEIDGALTDEGTSTNDESVSTTDSPLGYSTLSDRDNDSDSEI